MEHFLDFTDFSCGSRYGSDLPGGCLGRHPLAETPPAERETRGEMCLGHAGNSRERFQWVSIIMFPMIGA